MERWRPVLSFEGLYEASDAGNIRSVRSSKGTSRFRILRSGRTKNGYRTVVLYRGTHKDKFTRYVHRLVYEAFCGRIQPKAAIHHLNQDRSDNRLCNLALRTYAKHLGEDHGLRGSGCHTAKVTEAIVRQIRKETRRPFTIGQLAERFGVGRSTICGIVNEQRWAAENVVNRSRGETHHKAKLTQAQVHEIRSLYRRPTPYAVLADRYGVAVMTIGKIARGDTWQHVKANE